MSSPSLFIRLFDFYGHEFKLNIQGQNSYRTFLGSIVGLLSVLSILSISVYFTISLFQRNNMSVIYNNDETRLPVNNLTDVPILIAVGDLKGIPINPNGIFSLEVQYIEYINTKDQNNQSVIQPNIKIIPLKRCESSDLTNYEDLFQKVNPSNWYCISPGKYNLTTFGRYGDLINGFSMLQIFLMKCKNQSNIYCKSQKEIDSALSSSKIAISYVNSVINHYNYYTPNELKLETTVLSISPYLSKKYYYYLGQNIYTVDYGFVFQDQKSFNFFKFDGYTIDVEQDELINLSGKSYITNISIRNSAVVAYNYRTYFKLQTLLANIGGVIEAIMLISGLSVKFITNNFVLQNIFNIIFKFENEKLDNFYGRNLNNEILANFNFINLKSRSLNSNKSALERKKTNFVSGKIKLSWMEKLGRPFCMKRNKNLQIIQKCESYLIQKLSVEHLIREFCIMDKMVTCVKKKLSINEFDCNLIPYSVIAEEHHPSPIRNNSQSEIEIQSRIRNCEPI